MKTERSHFPNFVLLLLTLRAQLFFCSYLSYSEPWKVGNFVSTLFCDYIQVIMCVVGVCGCGFSIKFNLYINVYRHHPFQAIASHWVRCWIIIWRVCCCASKVLCWVGPFVFRIPFKTQIVIHWTPANEQRITSLKARRERKPFL